MCNDNFWTDELALEFAANYDDLTNKLNIGQSVIREFKKSKRKSKDWEILSFETQGRIYQYAELGITNLNHFLTNKEFKIHSVKRSDGEVFTVGETVYYDEDDADIRFKYKWVIDHFYIRDDGVMLARGKDMNPVETIDSNCYLKKAKQPLFKTEDGKDIYANENCFEVTSDFRLYPVSYYEDAKPNETCKYFSTEEAAKEYVLHNKPVLSLNDVMSFISNAMINEETGITKCDLRHHKLKQLVQSKIQQTNK